MVPWTASNRYSEPRRASQILALNGPLVALRLYDLADRGDAELDVGDHVDSAVTGLSDHIDLLVVHLL